MLGDGAEPPTDELLRLPPEARVYALVGAGSDGVSGNAWLPQLPRVLVRQVPRVPATAIYAGKEARLRIGGGFVLHLDEHQASAFRQVFLRLFWHEAEKESWPVDGKLEWRAAADRPFDVPHLLSTSRVRLDNADARLRAWFEGSPLGR
jgi:hypothetical protein